MGGGGGGGGGGVQFASGPIRKVGAFVWRTANTLSLIINGYKFTILAEGGAQGLT